MPELPVPITWLTDQLGDGEHVELSPRYGDWIDVYRDTVTVWATIPPAYDAEVAERIPIQNLDSWEPPILEPDPADVALFE